MATSLSRTSPTVTACEYCGNRLSDRYGRVMGDEDGRVHRCPDCDTDVRLHRGSAAGKDIDWPDPAEHPERNGGEYA